VRHTRREVGVCVPRTLLGHLSVREGLAICTGLGFGLG
jgi:hypothetical protein